MDNNQTGGVPVERDPAKQSLLALINAGRMAELFLCVLEAESNPAIGAAIASWARDYSTVFDDGNYVRSTNNVLRNLRAKASGFWQLFDAVLFDDNTRRKWVELLKNTEGNKND
jgi:hypothetical protein